MLTITTLLRRVDSSVIQQIAVVADGTDNGCQMRHRLRLPLFGSYVRGLYLLSASQVPYFNLIKCLLIDIDPYDRVFEVLYALQSKRRSCSTLIPTLPSLNGNHSLPCMAKI